MSVEALTAPQPDAAGSNPVATTEPTDNTVSDDDALGAAFDRIARDNGAARDNGRFASPNAEGQPNPTEEPLEGGEGEETTVVDPSTPSAGVPLPSNWRGLEEVWSKIPAELQGSIKAHEDKLHQTLSQQGQQLSAFKPIGDVINNYAEYFGGERGNYKPHEAIDFLFTLQRQMDQKPLDTLLQIADTYELRPHLQRLFSGQGEPQQGSNEANLVAEIRRLESQIQRMSDPSTIDRRISEKLNEERTLGAAEQVYNRVSKDMPLITDVAQEELVFFINKAWTKLGSAASEEAVLRAAGEMAINADPDLRARAAALKTAAASDPDRVAAAKRATATNLRSQSSGRARDLTAEEELGAVYDKHRG